MALGRLPTARREPDRRHGAHIARLVRAELEIAHPTELEIETLAYLRGAVVREAPARGARANLVRLGRRAVIGVAAGLLSGQRRFAIAHELGHLELHPHVNYLGLCTSADLLPVYRESGREEEANAFATELLMPEDLYALKCDVAKVRWEVVEALAAEFQVSLTAAALRFIDFSPDRVAVVCSKRGAVEWCASTCDFGYRILRGTKLDSWSLAHDFFAKGVISRNSETVSASAWINPCRRDGELIEHSRAMPSYEMVMSLLWIPVDSAL